MKNLFLILTLLLNACTYQYLSEQTSKVASAIGVSPHTDLSRMRQVVLSPLDKVCVSVGEFKQNSLPEKSFYQLLNVELSSALQQRFAQVTDMSTVTSLESSFNSAQYNRCSLLVFPNVLTRDDKVWSVNEWDSGVDSWSDIGLDRLQLRIDIWDVNNKQLIDYAVVNSRSAWMQFKASSSENLVRQSLGHYLDQLVAVQ